MRRKDARSGTSPTTPCIRTRDICVSFDIKPMYQAYAAVAVTNETTLASLNIGTDAVPIGEPQPLLMTGKTVTMKVQLPDGFIASTSDKVYVKHITDSGDRFYDTIVTEEGGHFFATFTNPDGFSEFVFTRESLEPPTPPTGTATRAEAAAMFQRFCENVVK